jgi:hypothetical protein
MVPGVLPSGFLSKSLMARTASNRRGIRNWKTLMHNIEDRHRAKDFKQFHQIKKACSLKKQGSPIQGFVIDG